MKLKFGFVFLAALLAAALVHGAASAHGKTTVGDYDLEIGFHNEPVIVGAPNSLDLFVTNAKTGEKVNNLQDSLQAELIFGPNHKTFKLEPQDGVDGAYTAFVIPTVAGDYTWHIFGKINTTPVDVSMTSSPDTFNSAEPADSYLFPAQAQNTPATTIALIAGGAGVVIGIAGFLTALAALRAARRSKAG